MSWSWKPEWAEIWARLSEIAFPRGGWLLAHWPLGGPSEATGWLLQESQSLLAVPVKNSGSVF